MSTVDKVQNIIDVKNEMKDILKLSDEEIFRNYPQKMRELLKNNSSEYSDEWQPEADWWDIETILENDTEDYEEKAIFLLTDKLDDENVITIKGFTHYKLSDGQEFEKANDEVFDISNIFDISKDKECSEGYKTRYIIGYRHIVLNKVILTPINAIYTVFKNISIYTQSSNVLTSSTFAQRRFLEGVKFINCTFVSTAVSYLFYTCYSLQSVIGMDLSNVINFASIFNSNYRLRKIPQIDFTNAKSISSGFIGLSNVKYLPDFVININVSISSFISGLYALIEFPEIKSTTGERIKITSAFFTNLYSLINIKSLDYIIFSANQNVSASIYLNHSSLLKIIDALEDRTGLDPLTLTLGIENKAKLTEEELAMITNKNWIAN